MKRALWNQCRIPRLAVDLMVCGRQHSYLQEQYMKITARKDREKNTSFIVTQLKDYAQISVKKKFNLQLALNYSEILGA